MDDRVENGGEREGREEGGGGGEGGGLEKRRGGGPRNIPNIRNWGALLIKKSEMQGKSRELKANCGIELKTGRGSFSVKKRVCIKSTSSVPKTPNPQNPKTPSHSELISE